MKAFVLVCLLVGVPWAQQPKLNESQQLITFTSPDGTFQFNYPDILIRCEMRAQLHGEGYYWAQRECTAYHPVCGGTGHPEDSIVCIAYPRNQYTDSDMFEAATFSVSESDGGEKECTGDAANGGKILNIHGVRFNTTKSTDGGMNQVGQSTDYTTFHNGRCYALEMTVATADAQTFEPPARQLSKRDWHEVYSSLQQARDSFRFLK